MLEKEFFKHDDPPGEGDERKNLENLIEPIVPKSIDIGVDTCGL